MPEPKRPLKVFLCHAHADRDPVRALYARLTKDGVDAWLDKEKLLPGQDWELEIRKAVREADVVVVCLSKQFNQAGFRQKEVRLALDTAMEQPEGEIFIIPARLEECETLESLRRWHWVDLFEDNGYEMLMRALRARADRIHTILQSNRIAQTIKEREAAEVADRERIVRETIKQRNREYELRRNIRIGLVVIGLGILVGALLLSSSLIGKLFSPVISAPTATQTSSTATYILLTTTQTSSTAIHTSSTKTVKYTRYDIPVIGYPSFGPENAEITLVEFAEFQDPFSKRWYNDTFRKLFDTYPGKIRLVYRNLPLLAIHPESFAAAEASLCANDQGAYWKFHDLLYTGDSLGNDIYLQYASNLGLDITIFKDCLSGEKHKEFVQNDYDFAKNLGIGSSPTFFINGLAIVGAQPLSDFTELIDKELAGEIP